MGYGTVISRRTVSPRWDIIHTLFFHGEISQALKMPEIRPDLVWPVNATKLGESMPPPPKKIRT